MADMEVNMVVDMESNIVADIDVDNVASMEVTITKEVSLMRSPSSPRKSPPTHHHQALLSQVFSSRSFSEPKLFQAEACASSKLCKLIFFSTVAF